MVQIDPEDPDQRAKSLWWYRHLMDASGCFIQLNNTYFKFEVH